jgi:hypothetical protein
MTPRRQLCEDCYWDGTPTCSRSKRAAFLLTYLVIVVVHAARKSYSTIKPTL